MLLSLTGKTTKKLQIKLNAFFYLRKNHAKQELNSKLIFDVNGAQLRDEPPGGYFTHVWVYGCP